MKQHVDDKMEIGAACEAVEKQRDGLDFTAFCKTLKFEDKDKNRYKSELLKEEFERLVLTPPPPSEQPTRPPTPVATPMDADHESEAAPINAGSVAIVDGATTRYLALDPALSCGFAVVQLDYQGVILAIDVGVLDMNSVSGDGARGIALQNQLAPLLSPPPDHVFFEAFYGHGRESDQISIKLRGAIQMQLYSRSITYEEVAPHSWRAAIGAGGGIGEGKTFATKKEAKEKAKACLECLMGIAFPEQLYIRGKWLKFRLDASDAAGVGFWGVQQRHPGGLSFSPDFHLAAHAPRPRLGTRLSAAPDVASAAGAAPLSAQPDSSPPQCSTGSSSKANPVVSPSRPDAWACTLSPGCTLRCNHAGLCDVESAGPRTPRRVEYCKLAGKRSSPASDPARKARKTCPQLGAP